MARDPLTGVQIRVGVMGSASQPAEAAAAALARRLGRAIAESGCCLLTGACPGLPHEAVLGAREIGGHVIGISPAATLREHVEAFRSPYREYDVLVFTGLGVMGRELVNIRSSDIVVVMGGRSGTLGEFAIAYEEGKLIGVLSGTGGITDALREMETALRKDTGAEVMYDADPARLVDRLLRRYRSGDYVCACRPAAPGRPAPRRSGSSRFSPSVRDGRVARGTPESANTFDNSRGSSRRRIPTSTLPSTTTG